MHQDSVHRSELGRIREEFKPPEVSEPAMSACQSELIIPSESGMVSNMTSENKLVAEQEIELSQEQHNLMDGMNSELSLSGQLSEKTVRGENPPAVQTYMKYTMKKEAGMAVKLANVRETVPRPETPAMSAC